MSELYSFELLPDEPVLVATIFSSFGDPAIYDSYFNEAISILDSLDHPVHYITNIGSGKVKIFQDFLIAVNRAFRGQGAAINHPNIGSMIMVSTDKVLQLGAKGFNSEIFGNLSVPVFDTLEEALAYSRTLSLKG